MRTSNPGELERWAPRTMRPTRMHSNPLISRQGSDASGHQVRTADGSEAA